MKKEDCKVRVFGDNRINWQLIIVCIFSLLVTFYCLNQSLFSKYKFYKDLRFNIYWMERARNPTSFKGDLIADFSDFFTSPLLRWLYKAIFFIDVELLSKLLALPLCLLSSIYMYRLGDKIGRRYCGLFAGIIFVLAAWYNSNYLFFGIGNRGDFFPLLGVMFLYYFFIEGILGMALILILQSALYPPVFFICISCFIFFVISKIKIKTLLLFSFVIFSSFLILFNTYRKAQFNNFGQVYNIQEIKNMDDFKEIKEKGKVPFKEKGRIPLIYSNLFDRVFNNRSGIGELGGRLGILSISAFICFIFTRKKQYLLIPKLGIFILFSVIFFILANIFMLKLFEPSRYLLLTLPLTLIIIISICLSRYLDSIPSKKKKIIFTIFIIIVLCLLFSNRIKPGYTTIQNIELYNYLENLPNDTLIAGHPLLLDNIPLLARKKVFLTSELSVPYFKKYYEEMKRRTYAFFNAYYSESFNAVFDFCRKNEINYFIVRKNDFLKDYLVQKKFYYLPFNNFVKKIISKNAKFALTLIPHKFISYEDKEYIVMKIGQINP